MREDRLTFKKGDYIFIGVVAIIAFVLILLQLNAKQGNQIQVTVQEQTQTYSLAENQRIPLKGETDSEEMISDGTVTNILVIENGQVYMESANCPDQVCVKQKPIYRNGEMIICLPNKIYVEVENNTRKEIDN